MRAAAIQLNATDDTDRNLERADRLVRDAAARGAELVVLPEKWTRARHARAHGRRRPDAGRPGHPWAQATAAELGIDLIAGSIYRAPGPTPSRAATPACTSVPTGEIAAVYRKIHLFDVEVDGARLRRVRPPRRRATRSSSPSWPTAPGLGMSICYDLRFPELYRILAVRGARA